MWGGCGQGRGQGGDGKGHPAGARLRSPPVVRAVLSFISLQFVLGELRLLRAEFLGLCCPELLAWL